MNGVRCINKKDIFLAALCALTTFGSYPQVRLDRSLDMIFGNAEKTYEILSIENRGLALYRDVTSLENSIDRTWELLLLDMDLETQWQTILKSGINQIIIASCFEEPFLYFLLQNQNTSDKGGEIYRIDIITKKFSSLSINSFFPKKINYFTVVNSSIILGGQEKNKPAMVVFPGFVDRPVILQGIYGKRSEIVEIYHDDRNLIFSILYSYRNLDGNLSLAVKSYNYEGRLIEENSIEPDGTLQLVDGRTRIIANRRLIAGLYLDRGTFAANGYFTASIDPRGNYKINYFPLNEEKIPQSLSEYSQDSLASDLEIIENIPANSANIVVREIIEVPGQLLLLTETIRPGDMNSSAREKAGGKVRFTKGAITSINVAGDINWYSEYQLSGYYTDIQPALTKVWCRNDTTLLFFYHKGTIASRKIRNGEVILEYANTSLEHPDVQDEEELHDFESTYEIRHWYGPFYLYIRRKYNPGSIDEAIILSLRKLEITNKKIFNYE